jgi:hypothetical protein
VTGPATVASCCVAEIDVMVPLSVTYLR